MIFPRIWLAAACVALLAASYGIGRSHGSQAAEARQARDVAALEGRLAVTTQALNAAAARIEAERQTLDTLALELEDEARRDGIDRTPGPDSLRRIKAGWGAAGGP